MLTSGCPLCGPTFVGSCVHMPYRKREDKMPNRKDYIKRLITGVRQQIADDPDTIEAVERFGAGTLPARWCDAEILCILIEEEVLNVKE